MGKFLPWANIKAGVEWGGKASQIKKYVLVQKVVARLGGRGGVTEVSEPRHLPLRDGGLENSPDMGPGQGIPGSPSSSTATRQP